MPIKGLTNRPPQFPCIGQLRKGGVKPEGNRGPGRDLDYFRFDTDDERAREMFTSAHGDKPRHVTVYLPYPTTDQNFSAWQESWTAAQLNHRCDGEVCYSYDASGQLVPNGQPCPDKSKPKADRNRCKQVGRLQVIVPALERFAYVTVLTSSLYDIIALSEQLSAIEALRGKLQGIPMILSRHEREISMPKPDGSRQRVKKWMLAIEVSPEWAALELQSMQRIALAGPAPAGLLPAPLVVDQAGATALLAATNELWNESADDQPDEGDYTEDEAAPEPADQIGALIENLSGWWEKCAAKGKKLPASHASMTLNDKTPEQLQKLIDQAKGWYQVALDAEAAQTPMPA